MDYDNKKFQIKIFSNSKENGSFSWKPMYFEWKQIKQITRYKRLHNPKPLVNAIPVNSVYWREGGSRVDPSFLMKRKPRTDGIANCHQFAISPLSFLRSHPFFTISVLGFRLWFYSSHLSPNSSECLIQLLLGAIRVLLLSVHQTDAQ